MRAIKVCLAGLIIFGFAGPALAERIAIIGTGQVAGALGPEFSRLGHTIVYGSRDPDRQDVQALVARTGSDASATTPADSVVGADIVVLAVPGLVVDTVVESLGNLDAKIVIDPTNPLVRDDSGRFALQTDSSNGELIQRLAPGAQVVKAFNTLNWRTMVDPDSAGGPVTVPLAGNSNAAKQVVAGLVEGLGLEALDVGPIEHARHVEGMLILWINNRFAGGEAFEYHLRPAD
ncbi:MAG: NAD(P)-binding domain-containing protein [Woeseiaceae bacterium]|nr:NAD(P)-binding domain-containing protein [Woeseiaceae bacterium]